MIADAYRMISERPSNIVRGLLDEEKILSLRGLPVACRRTIFANRTVPATGESSAPSTAFAIHPGAT